MGMLTGELFYETNTLKREEYQFAHSETKLEFLRLDL